MKTIKSMISDFREVWRKQMDEAWMIFDTKENWEILAMVSVMILLILLIGGALIALVEGW